MARMKALRPLTGTGYHADPGEVFSVPDHVAEELAIGGNAIYMFDAPLTFTREDGFVGRVERDDRAPQPPRSLRRA